MVAARLPFVKELVLGISAVKNVVSRLNRGLYNQS